MQDQEIKMELKAAGLLERELALEEVCLPCVFRGVRVHGALCSSCLRRAQRSRASGFGFRVSGLGWMVELSWRGVVRQRLL